MYYVYALFWHPLFIYIYTHTHTHTYHKDAYVLFRKYTPALTDTDGTADTAYRV